MAKSIKMASGKDTGEFRPMPDLATFSRIFMEAADKFDEIHNKDQKSAKNMMKKEGILDKKGNLNLKYKG